MRTLKLKLAVWITLLAMPSLSAADRTTLFVPLPHEAVTGELPDGTYPDQAFGAAGAGWHAYVRLWQAHHQNPADPAIRRFLGLPLKQSFEVKSRPGRAAPQSLRWKAGSYLQLDTPHFVIHSRADEETGQYIAEDLEKAYWIWTQMFFPLWEANAQVSGALAEMPKDMPVADFLRSQSSRISIRRRMKVVLFRDANDYRQTLENVVPGVARSTGYYDNGQQTTYLYATQPDDAATRRHELVHQMFREATRSALRRQLPGKDEGFWLIEGIAGYFESLWVGNEFATVGGWDASRLQFARFRVLVNGDVMPMGELRADGLSAAQQRPDLARWYAHAIAQTHHLLDSGSTAARQTIYQQLADRYRIKVDFDPSKDGAPFASADRGLLRFLQIDDQHLQDNIPATPPKQIVLADCQVSEQGLATIPASPNLRWLDLAGLPVGNRAVFRLAPNPFTMEQLRLERTRIDSGLKGWLAKATNLRELDLSSTRIDDESIRAINAPNLSVLWLTGTQVSDASIPVIASMRSLQSVDLQQTRVTGAGIGRLRSTRPKLEINLLGVQAQ